MKTLNNNLVLNELFQIEILNKISYLELYNFTFKLDIVIERLLALKKKEVLLNNYEKAMEHQKYLHNVISNKNTILDVMLTNELKSYEDIGVGKFCLN